MVSKSKASNDFRKQVLGYGLTTAEIVYRRPDRHWLLQTYVWQNYDMFLDFPALKNFLTFWETALDGPLFAVTPRSFEADQAGRIAHHRRRHSIALTRRPEGTVQGQNDTVDPVTVLWRWSGEPLCGF
jgi:uncharacterized protein Usg